MIHRRHALRAAVALGLLALAPGTGRAALASGSLEAWVAWDPFLSAAEQQSGARRSYAVEPVSREGLAEQQSIADAFRTEGLLPRAVDASALAIWAPPSLRSVDPLPAPRNRADGPALASGPRPRDRATLSA